MGAKKRKRDPSSKKYDPHARRLGIWRRKGSVYISLSGEYIRQKELARSACMQDDAWLANHGGVLSIPPPPVGRSRQVTDWGVPQSVSQVLVRTGIKSLYAWQAECLEKICNGNWGSVIYSAPTSGGKSLVADMVMIRRLLYEGRRAMILCPFVSICKERANFLRSILQPCGIVVEEFHGPVGKPWHTGVDVAVCTVQKGLSILHRIVGNEVDDESEDEVEDRSSQSFSQNIGTVIVDEFHLATEQRSSVMESFVSRLGLLPDRNEVLLIGMSATLSPESQTAIKSWLSCHTVDPCLMFNCSFRPVELSIFTKRGKMISPVQPSDSCFPRELEVIFDNRTDNDFFASLVHESMNRGSSTIVFCATRNWCENACSLLARLLGPMNSPIEPTLDQNDLNYVSKCQRTEIHEALKLLSPSGVHPILATSLMYGIAFHHAGLTSEERTIIETGFRTKAITVLCATSTLSAGVNLPAERVILRTLSAASGGQQTGMTAKSLSAKVKQMVGRAGRAGHAARGEAIIMCSNEKEERLVCEIFSTSDSLDGKSGSSALSLPEDARWVAKEILETISFLGKTRIEYFLREFARSKLCLPAETVRDAIQFLLKNKLVSMVESVGGGSLMPSVMGDALAHSSLPTEEAESVFRELNTARSKLCLSGDDLHLLFLITPPVSVTESEFDEFTASSDVFMNKEVRSILGSETDTPARRKRMMVALMLRDLTCGNEAVSGISAVARRYGVQTGTVQYLQSNAATYCAMVSSFCERLQWNSLAAALNSVKPRLHFGVPDELLPLVEVEGVSPARARALARAGLTSVKKIARSKPIDIALVLARSAETSETAQRLLDLTSRMIINNARIKLGWTQFSNPADSDDSSVTYGLFPSISPPVLMQLIGTQREDPNSIEPTLAEASDVENEAPLKTTEPALDQAESVLGNFASERAESVAATLSQRTDAFDVGDDEFYVHALRMIDTAPPRRRNRRISEMTTIDARDQGISENFTGTLVEETAADLFEETGLDSLILKSIDFNKF